MPPYVIRMFGDPVLRQRARDVDEFDGTLAHLVDGMVETMYAAPGAGLAAPQVGVQKRLFVFDIGEGPVTVVNPEIVETSGEWTYEEGCLSVPGLYFPITRPNKVTLRGLDVDGKEVLLEGDELLGRVFQHEVDHLDGVLLLERLDDETRRTAMRLIREQTLTGRVPPHRRDEAL